MTKEWISNSGTEESGRLQFKGCRKPDKTDWLSREAKEKKKEKAEMIKWLNK